MKDLETLLAKIISILFNPFLIIALAITLGNLDWVKNFPGPIIFFLIFIIIVPFLIHYVKLGGQSSEKYFTKSLNRSERNSIYLLSLFTTLFTLIALSYLQFNYWNFTILIAFIFITLLYFVNRFIDKVSVHLAALTFAVFYLIDKLDLIFALSLILLPFVMWARVKLHKHTWIQLFLGIVVGSLVGLMSWLI